MMIVRASDFKAEETGEYRSDGWGRMGQGVSVCQVGYEAWICDGRLTA